MHIDGNNVKFNNEDVITEAHANGILTDSIFDKYQEVASPGKNKATKARI